MTIKYSTTLRNALLDEIETQLGASPRLYIRTGAPPAVAAADTGTLLATMILPADWMAAASGGTKGKSGVWNATASASGTAGHFRIKDAASTANLLMQGTVGTSAADLIVDSVTFTAGQAFTITSFSITGTMP